VRQVSIDDTTCKEGQDCIQKQKSIKSIDNNFFLNNKQPATIYQQSNAKNLEEPMSTGAPKIPQRTGALKGTTNANVNLENQPAYIYKINADKKRIYYTISNIPN